VGYASPALPFKFKDSLGGGNWESVLVVLAVFDAVALLAKLFEALFLLFASATVESPYYMTAFVF
jgi:hypothetical protein